MAGGSGNCGSAAAGAAASVVIANLISGLDRTPRDANGDGVVDALTIDQQNARVNLITTLVAALASGTGLDAQVATTSAAIEAENNKTRNFRLGNGKIARIADGPGEGLSVAQIIAKFGIDNHPDLKAIAGAYGTRDPEQLQAIVNLIAAGKSATEIKAVQADAAAAYGKGTPEAKAALVDIANGRSTPVDLVAHLANVRANYDSTNGAGSYDRLIAQGKVDDAATQARIDAAVSRANKELLLTFAAGPVGAAIPIIAGAAGTAAVANLGVSATTSAIQIGVTSATGAGLNVGVTLGQNTILGDRTTPGQITASAITGAIFVPGLSLSRFNSPALNATFTGGVGSGLGNLGGQIVDKGTNINLLETSTNVIIGGVVGGFVGTNAIDGFLTAPVAGRNPTIRGQIGDGLNIQLNELPRTLSSGFIQTEAQGTLNVLRCGTVQSCPPPVAQPVARPPKPVRKLKK